MTMNFETVQEALTDLLGNGANGQFRVCGYNNEPENAEAIRNENASVAVYFQSATIPKSSSGLNGPFTFVATYNIELSIASSAKADLETLNDPDSTQGERAAAMTALQNTRLLADQALNTLMGYVFTILFTPKDIDLGLDPGVARSRWIDAITKEKPDYAGELLISQAVMAMTIRFTESIAGEDLEPLTEIDLTLNLNEEPDGQAGVYENYEPEDEPEPEPEPEPEE
jgi:hypothetical protein